MLNNGTMPVSNRLSWVALGLLAWAAVGAALYSQHVLGMQPCPWCVLQRLIFVMLGAVALLGAALPTSAPRPLKLVQAALVALLALAGAAAALYQNRVAAKSASCDMTLADRIVSGLGVDARWPEVFEVRASCADAAVDLFGVPYELWGLALYLAIGATAILLARRR